MATKGELLVLMAKTVSDKKFRARFLKNPAQAAGSVGIKLTPKQAQFAKRLSSRIVEQGKQLDKLVDSIRGGMIVIGGVIPPKKRRIPKAGKRAPK